MKKYLLLSMMSIALSYPQFALSNQHNKDYKITEIASENQQYQHYSNKIINKVFQNSFQANGYVRMKDVTINGDLQSNGTVKFDSLRVTGNTNIIGGIDGVYAQFEKDFKVEGSGIVKLEDVNFNGLVDIVARKAYLESAFISNDLKIDGYLSLKDSTAKRIIVNESPVFYQHSMKPYAIKIKKSSFDNLLVISNPKNPSTEVTVIVSGATHIRGNIEFKGKKGVVILTKDANLKQENVINGIVKRASFFSGM
ncbi:MAG: hypothetical protein O3C05_01930 [Proteobacteria bacterium]|nr:hypothetical protein [Pseudomonadota bacterium]